MGTATSDAALLGILQSCETDLDGDTDFADLNRMLGEFNTLCP